MEIYILDMTKPRWEIKICGKTLMINKNHIDEMRKGDVVRYNEQFAISTNKEKLLEYANAIIDIRLSNLIEEVEYYKNMKVKVTRK